MFHVDGQNARKSNWMRNINTATTSSRKEEGEENLKPYQYRGQVYYMVYKPIQPDTELLLLKPSNKGLRHAPILVTDSDADIDGGEEYNAEGFAPIPNIGKSVSVRNEKNKSTG